MSEKGKLENFYYQNPAIKANKVPRTDNAPCAILIKKVQKNIDNFRLFFYANTLTLLTIFFSNFSLAQFGKSSELEP